MVNFLGMICELRGLGWKPLPGTKSRDLEPVIAANGGFPLCCRAQSIMVRFLDGFLRGDKV